MNSYSQWHEDLILLQFFGDQRPGFFVDVGAFDGIYFSNTYLLEQEGWSGICIEAHPDYAAQCRENRPGSTCIHGACIGDAAKERVTFYAESGGLFSSLSPNDGPAKRHYRVNLGLPFGGFQVLDVPAMTLNSVLANVNRDIDFISIDVEGSELDVLAGFDLERYQPRILLIEANYLRDAYRIDRYLARWGYCRAGQKRVNYFYCAKSDRTRGRLSSLIAAAGE